MVVAFPQQGQGVFAEHAGGIWTWKWQNVKHGQYFLLVPVKTKKKSFSGSEITVHTLQVHLFAKLKEDLELETTII